MNNDSFVLIDTIYRSRMTLLDILEDRGYIVENYRKFSPVEASAAVSSFPGLSFIAHHKDGEKICDVRYGTVSRQKLESFFEDIKDDETSNREVIVMIKDSISDAHHIAAIKQYMRMTDITNEKGEKQRRKLKVSFFSIYMIMINPLKHILVPKHEIVPEEEHKELMDSMYITSKAKFPEIKYHIDPITRCIGAAPGDIIKITRASASSGVAIIYRVCSP